MSLALLVGGGALAGLGGLVALGGALRLRELSSLPTRTCSTALPGEACRLTGRARAAEPLTSPLGRKACVAYRIVVGTQERPGRFVAVGRVEAGAADWRVEDAGGHVLVDAAGAELHFPETTLDYDPRVAQPVLEDLRRQAGDEGVLPVRFVEQAIPQDAEVFARGRLDEARVLGGRRDLYLAVPGREKKDLRRERLAAGLGVLCFLAGAALAVWGVLGR